MIPQRLIRTSIPALAVAAIAASASADRQLQRLGPAPKAGLVALPNTYPLRMNNVGDRVGYRLVDQSEHAICWNRAGCLELNSEPHIFSCANGVSDFGWIVGQTDTLKVDRNGRIVRQAFVWINGHLMIIDGLRSYLDSSANDVNRRGWVAGWFTVEDVGRHAALWTFEEYTETGPKIIDLGTLGGQESIAYSLNGSGLVVGQADTEILAPGTPHSVAFRYEYPMEIGMTALPDLVLGANSAALDVNDAGVIVGWAEDEQENRHAVVWRDGGVTDLGGFGGEWAQASAINQAGLIVGTACVPVKELPLEGCHLSPQRAFVVWNGALIDLNTLIGPSVDWLLLDATDINDRNEITGTAWHGGELWGYVLTLPAPGRSLAELQPVGRLTPSLATPK